MDRAQKINRLKDLLREDVAELYRHSNRVWNKPIVETLHQLRETNTRAVIFGGTLRSLLFSRLFRNQFGRPRDIDLVVSGITIEHLKSLFEESVKRETRFGGLQLERMTWQFDMWPLEDTWGFKQNRDVSAHFSNLPKTTFFNMEAVAIDVWTLPGRARSIYSGDDQFFEGLLDRVLEINHEANPFPSLCVIRAFVFASSTGFAIGPRLAAYLRSHSDISDDEIFEIQMKHYGELRLDRDRIRRYLDVVHRHESSGTDQPVQLPYHGQLAFWPEYEKTAFKIHLLQDSRPMPQANAHTCG
ncbi:MAG: hypothetical protein ACF8K1_12745 [Phycisphaerales bacterium JB047]